MVRGVDTKNLVLFSHNFVIELSNKETLYFHSVHVCHIRFTQSESYISIFITTACSKFDRFMDFYTQKTFKQRVVHTSVILRFMEHFLKYFVAVNIIF